MSVSFQITPRTKFTRIPIIQLCLLVFSPFQKGCGYHLDLFMVGLMLGVCSLMGLPWFVAATVLSITHVNSLKLESECSAPGEQPRFLGIREQRFTGLMIFTLMGCSVFMTSVLKVRCSHFGICSFWFTGSCSLSIIMWHGVSLKYHQCICYICVCFMLDWSDTFTANVSWSAVTQRCFNFPLVYSHACVVWCIPLHGSIISARYTGKLSFCFLAFHAELLEICISNDSINLMDCGFCKTSNMSSAYRLILVDFFYTGILMNGCYKRIT